MEKENPTEVKVESKSEKKEFKTIVRLGEVDCDGSKPVKVAIRRIKGVSFMLSNAIAQVSGLGDKKLGELSEKELEKLKEILENPEKFNIPSWLYNRRRDPETGENKHLIASQLQITQKMDINKLKKLRCYRGIRHALGLPVRGQRTKYSFRKGKTVGVKKSKARKSGK